jgi:hypothetical protein
MALSIKHYNMNKSFLHKHDHKFMGLVIAHYEVEKNNIFPMSHVALAKYRASTLAYFNAIPNSNISDPIVREVHDFIFSTREKVILLEEILNNLKEQYKKYEYTNSTLMLLISEGLNVDDIKIDQEFLVCRKTIDSVQEDIANLNTIINLRETDILEYLSHLWLRENPDRKY